MTDVEVRPVRGVRDLRRFIDLPYRLHAGTPWIPPVRLERWAFLNRRVNPYFSHGEAAYFLALRGDRVVGRISAQVDTAFNEFHGNRWGMFGFLEFDDDPAILRGLLDAAEGWLRARRCDRMIGPMDFSIKDESGVLIEGHDLEPLVKQSWHPKYYQRRCEEAGLAKVMDLLSWHADADYRHTMAPTLQRVAERARVKHGITIRPMSRRHLRKDLDAFAEVYNDAWSTNWGFVPYSEKDLDGYALDLQFVYSPGWFLVAEHGQETVGVAITVLDINQVYKRMNGRIFPLGWWHFATRHRYVDQLRVGFLGVKTKYQYTGTAAALYLETFDNAARSGLRRGEAGWTLETNHSMNRIMEAFGTYVVKRYRLYERPFEGGRAADNVQAARAARGGGSGG